MAAVQDGTVPSSTTVNKSAHPFDKVRLDALLNRRFFYAPAFEIYGGKQDGSAPQIEIS